jgi:hypothetical protein
MADLDALGVRIDDPGDLGTAAEEVTQPFVDLSARVARGEDLDR